MDTNVCVYWTMGKSLSFGRVQHAITKADFQPTTDGGLLILVTGQLKNKKFGQIKNISLDADSILCLITSRVLKLNIQYKLNTTYLFLLFQNDLNRKKVVAVTSLAAAVTSLAAAVTSLVVVVAATSLVVADSENYLAAALGTVCVGRIKFKLINISDSKFVNGKQEIKHISYSS
ncbi:hypothetical protein KUTeg_018805 [Tegillarca granosa]|uniref:Nuclear transport factor 2 domain-containing protein n=1 Tax=Tegillarca granosa TaxID=220873 RepID=A0ABQ9EAM3_TEGGR|nr:hypothetical protein KUTeg_018805 [Tegillarca granosa]